MPRVCILPGSEPRSQQGNNDQTQIAAMLVSSEACVQNASGEFQGGL